MNAGTFFELFEKGYTAEVLVVIMLLATISYLVKPYQLFIENKKQKKQDVYNFVSLLKDIDFDNANLKEKHLIEMSVSSLWGKELEFDKYHALIKAYDIKNVRKFFGYFNFLSIDVNGVVTIHDFFKSRTVVYVRATIFFLITALVGAAFMFAGSSVMTKADGWIGQVLIWNGFLVFIISFIHWFMMPKYHEAISLVKKLEKEKRD